MCYVDAYSYTTKPPIGPWPRAWHETDSMMDVRRVGWEDLRLVESEIHCTYGPWAQGCVGVWSCVPIASLCLRSCGPLCLRSCGPLGLRCEESSRRGVEGGSADRVIGRRGPARISFPRPKSAWPHLGPETRVPPKKDWKNPKNRSGTGPKKEPIRGPWDSQCPGSQNLRKSLFTPFTS